jgi:hypothetical protein
MWISFGPVCVTVHLLKVRCQPVTKWPKAGPCAWGVGVRWDMDQPLATQPLVFRLSVTLYTHFKTRTTFFLFFFFLLRIFSSLLRFFLNHSGFLDHIQLTHTVGLLWTSDQPVAEASHVLSKTRFNIILQIHAWSFQVISSFQVFVYNSVCVLSDSATCFAHRLFRPP